MNAWEKLANTQIKDKKKYTRLFVQEVKKAQKSSHAPLEGEQKRKDHFIVTEDGRMGGYFIHIVPAQLYLLFKELQTSAPHAALGYSVMAGKYGEKEVRVGCFGIPCSEAGMALARSTKRCWSYKWRKKSPAKRGLFPKQKRRADEEGKDNL